MEIKDFRITSGLKNKYFNILYFDEPYNKVVISGVQKIRKVFPSRKRKRSRHRLLDQYYIRVYDSEAGSLLDSYSNTVSPKFYHIITWNQNSFFSSSSLPAVEQSVVLKHSENGQYLTEDSSTRKSEIISPSSENHKYGRDVVFMTKFADDLLMCLDTIGFIFTYSVSRKRIVHNIRRDPDFDPNSSKLRTSIKHWKECFYVNGTKFRKASCPIKLVHHRTNDVEKVFNCPKSVVDFRVFISSRNEEMIVTSSLYDSQHMDQERALFLFFFNTDLYSTETKNKFLNCLVKKMKDPRKSDLPRRVHLLVVRNQFLCLGGNIGGVSTVYSLKEFEEDGSYCSVEAIESVPWTKDFALCSIKKVSRSNGECVNVLKLVSIGKKVKFITVNFRSKNTLGMLDLKDRISFLRNEGKELYPNNLSLFLSIRFRGLNNVKTIDSVNKTLLQD